MDGFPSGYISVHKGPEYIWFDLGADVPLSEISYWGYANTNSNGMREFNLSFATCASRRFQPSTISLALVLAATASGLATSPS